MTSLDLQIISKRADHFKDAKTNVGYFYAHDVPELLKEIERLQNELYKALWGKP